MISDTKIEWLEFQRKFTGDEPHEMDNKDPWVIVGTVNKVPTPEAGDNYLVASILLPRGSKSAQGKVKAWE